MIPIRPHTQVLHLDNSPIFEASFADRLLCAKLQHGSAFCLGDAETMFIKASMCSKTFDKDIEGCGGVELNGVWKLANGLACTIVLV